MNYKRLIFVLLAVLISIPLFVAYGAGGRIEGKVIDPKGAAVPGATVKVTNQTTKQEFTAVTDAQGRYKVEGLPAGVYDVSVAAAGFKETRQADVKVDDDAVKQTDLRLEIAPIEAEVKVSTTAQKGNVDPTYQTLRQLAKAESDFTGNYAVVNNLILKRDAANFNLKSGELYFITPVDNRTTAAVFIGNGELTLMPPTQIEKNSLKIFTGEEGITEEFTHLVLRFTDKTFDEIKSSPNATMKTGGPEAAQARELYRNNQDVVRKRLRDNRELRTLYDIYNPANEGFFNAFYPKGAYILPMLRMMMYKQGQGGDANFQAMMKDFVQTHFNQDVSTEDFKAIVEKHMTKERDVAKDGKMDWYFNEWVYGTEIPAYKLEYNVGSDGMLNGKLTQSGVSDNFVMLVPLYADFGKGWAKLGSATIGNATIDIKNVKLPGVPKRMAVSALNDVLA